MDNGKYYAVFKGILIDDYYNEYVIFNLKDVKYVNEADKKRKQDILNYENGDLIIELNEQALNDFKITINKDIGKRKNESIISSLLCNKYFKIDSKKDNNKFINVTSKFEKALCSYIFDMDAFSIINDYKIKEENIEVKKEVKREEKKEQYNKLFGLKENNVISYKEALRKMKNYVLCQDDQIEKVLYTIYNNIQINDLDLTDEEKMKKKQNILIAGNTGCGKTEIALQLSKIFDLPIVIEDMNRFTEAGYVGADIDSIYTHLINAANGDLERAQKGILVLDEIDKLASTSKDSVSRDGVQNGLLKLLEGGKQIYNVKKNFASADNVFDTSNLTIIGLGAFEGIEKIRDERIRSSSSRTIGFSTEEENKKYIDKNITTEDYIKFGINSQILGRLQSKVKLNNLGFNELVSIEKNAKNSISNINKKIFELKNIKLTLTDGYYEEVAKKASYLGNGARSLSEVVEDTLKDVTIKTFEENDIKEIILDEETVLDSKKYIIKRS